MMKKGDIFVTRKAHFFAVTATQKEGLITFLEAQKTPNGSRTKNILL